MEEMKLDFDKYPDKLIPVIAQDNETGEVLMLAYASKEAFEKTLSGGKACYWSRSRQQLWVKGETSGQYQEIKEILVDCDQDAVIYKIEQKGKAACHTGHRSCFYRAVRPEGLETIAEKAVDPKDLYGKG